MLFVCNGISVCILYFTLALVVVGSYFGWKQYNLRRNSPDTYRLFRDARLVKYFSVLRQIFLCRADLTRWRPSWRRMLADRTHRCVYQCNVSLSFFYLSICPSIYLFIYRSSPPTTTPCSTRTSGSTWRGGTPWWRWAQWTLSGHSTQMFIKCSESSLSCRMLFNVRCSQFPALSMSNLGGARTGGEDNTTNA